MQEEIEVEAGAGGLGVRRPGSGGVQPVRRAARHGAPGPRPVRPMSAPVAVRPAQVARPRVATFPVRPGQRVSVQRVLVRQPAPAPVDVGLRERIRQVAAGIAVVLGSAVLVVGLGLLADVAAADGAGLPAGPIPGAEQFGPVERPPTGGPIASVR